MVFRYSILCVFPVLGIVFMGFFFTQAKASDKLDSKRKAMVEEQLISRDIRDYNVIKVMKKVPREEFVPEDIKKFAYKDRPLPIGHDQTISQPYIVAKMTEAAGISKKDRVLEIGTGSGYQAAVLGELSNEVYSIEILEPLANRASETLKRLGYRNVHVKAGDGFHGWPEKAPFDVILVTAAPEEIPPKLLEQLDPNGGRMVIPVGKSKKPWLEPQKLLKITREKDEYHREYLLPVAFVPMTGETQKK